MRGDSHEGSTSADVSVELSSQRTGLSFQRTRMSADRTLMSAMRTSLSLISFGFTIYQLLDKLEVQHTVFALRAPRNFGIALLVLGIGMMIVGIAFHSAFMLELRRQRTALIADGLVSGESAFPVSYTLIIAVCLLVLGIGTVVSLAFHVGPFS